MTQDLPPEQPLVTQYTSFFWRRLNFNLKTKAILIAIALGTIPVAVIGFVAYTIADLAITKQIYTAQEVDTIAMVEKVQIFLQERSLDVESIANLSIFRNPQWRQSSTFEQKSQELAQIAKYHPVYESITLIDLQGNDFAVSKGQPGNHKNDEYFQAVIKTGKSFISQPRFNQTVGEKVVYFASPVTDAATNQIIAVLRARVPIQNIEQLIEEYAAKGSTYHLADKNGNVFITNDTEGLDTPATEHLPQFAQLRSAGTVTTFEQYEPLEKRYIVGSYAAIKNTESLLEQVSALGWDGFLLTEESIAFAPQTQFGRAIVLGTIITGLIISAIAVLIANRLINPITQAATVIERIGQGDLSPRLPVNSTDELGKLALNINLMASQIQDLLERQKQENAQKEQIKIQTEVAQQERERSHAMQQKLLSFLASIEEASTGNLTVRANITDDSIGIVADFFNSIIENLRDIVAQVKITSIQVNSSISNNETAIEKVAQETLQQTEQINQALNQVEAMAQSIQEVANNAQQAALVSRTASVTAETGGQAIEDTVNSILQLRETIASTAKKVKRLGESSQEISKVVSLINQIAMQTNLLAINASIEASRAGEEGRGFAVVAEEVGELATKSAEATQEIEEIVENIQEETQEVVAAMEVGTTQVVEGTRLVQNTKNSLDKIAKVSHQIDLLLQSISSATISQAQTSKIVTKLMEEIASVSQRTSNASLSVSESLEETVKIAQQLEASVDTFTV